MAYIQVVIIAHRNNNDSFLMSPHPLKIHLPYSSQSDLESTNPVTSLHPSVDHLRCFGLVHQPLLSPVPGRLPCLQNLHPEGVLSRKKEKRILPVSLFENKKAPGVSSSLLIGQTCITCSFLNQSGQVGYGLPAWCSKLHSHDEDKRLSKQNWSSDRKAEGMNA